MKLILIAGFAAALAPAAQAQDWSNVPVVAGQNIVGFNPNGTAISEPVATVGNDQTVLTECGQPAGQPTVPCNGGALSGVRGIPIAAFATSRSVFALQSGVAGLQQFVGDVRAEERRGIAASTAMASASMPSEPGRTSWVLNAAEFEGQAGFGGSVAHRFNLQIPLAVTAGISFTQSGQGIYRAGLAGEF
jgi:hypothetical protein